MLFAGFTNPFSVTLPELNQPLNVVAETLHDVARGSVGKGFVVIFGLGACCFCGAGEAKV
jgi:hypothetical protein